MGPGDPPAYASRHFSSAASGGCTGTRLFWLPVFFLQDLPCPSLSTLLAKGQVHWGAESLPRVQKGKIPAWKLCALSPPFTVPTTKSQLLWTEMEEKRDASLSINASCTRAEVPSGGQKKELLSLSGPGRDGSPERG